MGTMPVYGTNLQDDSQLLDTNSCLYAENYLLHGKAKMQKRPGQEIDFDTTESSVITLSEEYRNDYDIIAYGQKVRAYNTSTGVFTDIKTDFTANNSGFTGDRYGDYFFVNTFQDGLWRISQGITWAESYNLSGINTFYLAKNVGTTITAGATLTDTTTGHTAVVVTATEPTTSSMILTVNTLNGVFTLNGAVTGGTLTGATLNNVNPFTANLKITGATSGATAVILELTDNGATGSFVLGDITGTFINGEVITDTSSGRATTSALVAFSITAVTAPKGRIFKVIGKRAILVGLESDESGYNYSATDVGTSPPFTNWTTGTGYNDPGLGGYRNGGQALDVEMVGDVIFIAQKKGWYAFRISQTDSSGVSSKFDETVNNVGDFPVYKCKMTNAGMFAVTPSGIWRLVSLGQSNIPYSDQWELLTDSLGEDYFKDVTLTNSDLTYDSMRGFIYVTVGKDSATNNLVLATKCDLAGVEGKVRLGATSFLTGWNVLVFMQRGSDIYGTSAIDGIRHKLFVGQKDVNASIHSEYLQEVNFELTSAFNLEEFYAKGELSPASNITISFDTFDKTGYYEARRKSYQWVAQHSYTGGSAGWGSAGFDSSGWSGSSIASGLVPDFTGAKPELRGLSRMYLRFESDDYSEHILNWFSADISVIKQIRIRTLTEL